jgi:hypothetical protein
MGHGIGFLAGKEKEKIVHLEVHDMNALPIDMQLPSSVSRFGTIGRLTVVYRGRLSAAGKLTYRLAGEADAGCHACMNLQFHVRSTTV